MLKWLRRTSLWILAVPILTITLGAACNQAVIFANDGGFPVVWSKARQYERAVVLQKIIMKEGTKGADQNEIDQAKVRMEELMNGWYDETHMFASKKTHLNWLADWINLHEETDSPGDVLINIGQWMAGFMWPIFFWESVSKASKKE